jgi:DNA helicase-2/ATP-dependent DNA helicase PcrA
MELLEGSRRHVDRSAQTDDLDAIVALAALHPDVHGFEAWVRTSLRQPGTEDGVVLATIHSVKGREWPHVVVHDVSARLFPHRLSGDVEEERRVFHVALTRCSSSVTVVAGEPPSPFLDEMFEAWKPAFGPVRAPAAPGPAPTRSSAKSPTTAPGPRRRDEPTVVPTVGLELEHGGYSAPVVAVDDDGVTIQVGRGRVRVQFGSTVRVGGRPARLVRPAPAGDHVDRARAALRAWRLERSRSMSKPAFVIISDATLEAIVAEMPTSVVGLSRIKGIGPAKLEAYGDEILVLIESAADP